MNYKFSLILFAIILLFFAFKSDDISPRWSTEKANSWYSVKEWLVGCNFTPSTAINSIEFWSQESFDPETIDRELKWASDIGFNSIRVYLHYLVWARSPAGLKKRMEKFLDITAKHDINVMFVLFDDCWNENPNLGKQPDPIPGTHNSGWVQCPGGVKQLEDKALYPVLKAYTKDIIRHFANDERVIAWDLYNEPGNFDKFNISRPLLEQVFNWGREVNPSQPLTVGVWNWDEGYTDLNKIILNKSDVISFHHYNKKKDLFKWIDTLKQYDRPLFCTEYMARTRHNTFATHLPIFKDQRIAAYNWGLVSGKTQTIFMWDSTYTAEPATWFHDIFRKDGTPFNEDEIDLIKKITDKKK